MKASALARSSARVLAAAERGLYAATILFVMVGAGVEGGAVSTLVSGTSGSRERRGAGAFSGSLATGAYRLLNHFVAVSLLKTSATAGSCSACRCASNLSAAAVQGTSSPVAS